MKCDMTRQEFYDIMEMFGAYASIPSKTHAMMEILEMYPNLKSMTCEDALKWLENRNFEWYQKLQKKLGVEEDKNNLSGCCREFFDTVRRKRIKIN